ncbi:MAG: hypothetical protein AAB490_01440 [Patescibacteria group bacterium]
MLSRRVTLFIALAVFCAVVGGVSWFSARRSQKIALGAYVPDGTVFAFDLPREQLFTGRDSIGVTHERLLMPREGLQEYWRSLERTLGFRVDRLVWFITEDAGSLESGVLFRTPSSVSKRNATALAARSFEDFAWLKPGERYALIMRSSHVGMLAEASANERIGSPDSSRHLSNDVFAELYSTAEANEVLQTLLDPYGLGGLLMAQDHTPVNIRFDLRNEFPRVQYQRLSYEPSLGSERREPVLSVPDEYDFAIDRGVRAITTATSTQYLFSDAVAQFSGSFSRQYLVPAERITDSFGSLEGMLVAGDRWLVVSENESVLESLAREMTSWFHPVSRVSSFSDRTTYREYIKQAFDPVEVTIGGSPVRVWSRTVSTTDASMEARPDPLNLYMVNQGGLAYLSNDQGLLEMQLRPDTAAEPLTRAAWRCMTPFGARVEDIVSIVSGKRGSMLNFLEKSEKVTIVQTKEADILANFYLCIE